jgi:hypothetical protein
MSESKRFTGNMIVLSQVPKTDAGRQLQHALEEYAHELPPGIIQAAPRAPEYQQRNHRTCFYASLLAARMGIMGSRLTPSERMIAVVAENEGLLGPHGAETFKEDRERQSALVKRLLGIDISFIDQRNDDQRVEALTEGLHQKGTPLVFGEKGHWLVLDGFKRARRDISWIGMDPARGRRLEDMGRELTPPYIAARLEDSGLLLVVVEGPKPRFRSARRN